MTIASRRKKTTKQAKKKTKPLTLSNQHSSATVQLQTKGLFVSENQRKMEGNFHETLQETHKVVVEEESLSEDKDVAVEVSAADDDDYDGKSKFLSETKDDVDIDEHVESETVVDETQNVSETVVKSSDAIEANEVENTLEPESVELELKEEKVEDFVSLEDNNVVEEETELATSIDNNEGLIENEVVETVKDMTVTEEENVLSSTDVDLETSVPKSDYEVEKVISQKGIEESLVKSTSEKVEEHVQEQEPSSYESVKESLQQSSNVVDSENNSVTEQDKNEESRGIENQGSIITVTQRQQTSWKSCCGLFEVLVHGDR